MGMNSFRPIARSLALAASLLAASTLSACSSGEPSPPKKAPEKTVFDPLVQTEQRARDVQNTVDENAERTRKAAEAQERGDSSP